MGLREKITDQFGASEGSGHGSRSTDRNWHEVKLMWRIIGELLNIRSSGSGCRQRPVR